VHANVPTSVRDEVARVCLQAPASDTRTAGLEEVQRAIAVLDGRIAEMQEDYSAMCDVHRSEVGKLEAAASSMAPLAVLQLGALMEALAVSTAQQWESLAQSLGADLTQ
jgi:hypothetical protein